MIQWDKNKMMTQLVAKRKPGGEKTMDPTPMKNEVVKTEEGELDGRHMAAQEMIGAFKEGSAEKFMTSLGNFIDLHGSKPQPKE